MNQKYKTIRAVVEVRVPEHITEKRLVWHLKYILKWPLQLGIKGDTATLVRASVKSYGRVRTAEMIRDRELLAPGAGQ